MKYKCPSCKKPLYTRKDKRCANCGAELPDELLLTEKQRAFLDSETEKMKARAERLKKEDKPADLGDIDLTPGY